MHNTNAHTNTHTNQQGSGFRHKYTTSNLTRHPNFFAILPYTKPKPWPLPLKQHQRRPSCLPWPSVTRLLRGFGFDGTRVVEAFLLLVHCILRVSP